MKSRGDEMTSAYTCNDFIQEATHEFVNNAHHGYRYGQALFNVLLRHRPDLAERVQGTDLDPFHEDTLSVGGVINNFLYFAQENW